MNKNQAKNFEELSFIFGSSIPFQEMEINQYNADENTTRLIRLNDEGMCVVISYSSSNDGETRLEENDHLLSYEELRMVQHEVYKKTSPYKELLEEQTELYNTLKSTISDLDKRLSDLENNTKTKPVWKKIFQ